MRNISTIFGLFVSMLVAVSALAGEVNLPHTFQPNTKAKASEVNANFNAVRDAVNDNNSRIQSLESFKGNVAGSTCGSGNAVTGFSADGTPQCEDMNKGAKILSVTYPSSCFAGIARPLASSVSVTISRATIFDNDGNNDYNWIYCPFTLPEGVKILRIIADLYDVSTTNDLYVYFYHTPTPSGHVSSHSIGNTNGNSGFQQLVLDLSSENEVVLRGVGYGIYVYFPSDQDCGGTTCNSASNLSVYRATVIYEYDPTYSGPTP